MGEDSSMLCSIIWCRRCVKMGVVFRWTCSERSMVSICHILHLWITNWQFCQSTQW